MRLPSSRLCSSLLLVLGAGAGFGGAACHRDTSSTAMTTASPSATPGRASVADGDIAAAVTRHLKEDDALRSAPIAVAVTNGICTLTGSVESPVAKDRALRVVETLRGIRSIVDRLEILPVPRTDDQIKRDVLVALTHESATRAHPVAVAVSGGTVTLTGTAPSWSDKRFFAELAKTASGVKAA